MSNIKWEVRLHRINKDKTEKCVQVIGRYRSESDARIAKEATDATWYRLYDETNDVLREHEIKFTPRHNIMDKLRFKAVIVEIDTTDEDRIALERFNDMMDLEEEFVLGNYER